MMETIRSKEREWASTADLYLPIAQEGSAWRSSGPRPARLPSQGWKIHISATILSATEVLAAVGPILTSEGLFFKGISSLTELKKLNCGLHYGFSQVGKAFTIYLPNQTQLRLLAPKLHAATEHLSGPPVPYDLPYSRDSLVYYRYGAFQGEDIVTNEGSRVPDAREPNAAIPLSIEDPLAKARSATVPPTPGPLRLTFKAYVALSQRGKGGVYRALDLGPQPARLCIIKEGRRHGETDWDGRDGWWRINYEWTVLEELGLSQVPVPEVIAHFEESTNAYLIIEHIDGINLQEALLKAGRLSVSACLYLGGRIASLLASIHQAGWAWRDCKPFNLILCRDGQIRPLDFEGASRTDSADAFPWGTTGYVPPEWVESTTGPSHVAQDLFALGATLRQVLTGDIPSGYEPGQSSRIDRRLPRRIRYVIDSLMSGDPADRPPADVVAKELEAVLSAERRMQGQKAIERLATSTST